MDDGAEDAPLAMEKVTLGQIIHNNRDRLIYLFDIFGDRAYFLELTGSFESKPGISYPREIYVQAEAPDQYDPSKNVVSGEGSIFDDVMSEFSDFEGDDNYDGPEHPSCAQLRRPDSLDRFAAGLPWAAYRHGPACARTVAYS